MEPTITDMNGRLDTARRRYHSLLPGTVLTAALLAASVSGGRAQPVSLEDSGVPGAWAENPGLLQVEDHAEEGELHILLGPVYLPAHMPHMRAPVQFMEVPFDGWLHGFSWDLVDREGRPLPDEFLHHVNIIDVDHREVFSPIARRILAAGRETEAESLPGILGVPVNRGDRWAIVAMFANPTDTDHPRARLRVTLEYSTEEGRLVDPRNVFPFYTDVMPPVGPKSFPVPPGRTEESWTGSPVVDARILALGGHLHDYGTELRLEDTETGEVLWRVEPETSARPHHVVRVPVSQLWMKAGIPVKDEKSYRVVAVYENPTGRPAPDGGMGVVAGVVLADPGNFPPLDREDPAYVIDLWNTLTAPVRMDSQGHGGGSGHTAYSRGGDGSARGDAAVQGAAGHQHGDGG